MAGYKDQVGWAWAGGLVWFVVNGPQGVGMKTLGSKIMWVGEVPLTSILGPIQFVKDRKMRAMASGFDAE